MGKSRCALWMQGALVVGFSTLWFSCAFVAARHSGSGKNETDPKPRILSARPFHPPLTCHLRGLCQRYPRSGDLVRTTGGTAVNESPLGYGDSHEVSRGYGANLLSRKQRNRYLGFGYKTAGFLAFLLARTPKTPAPIKRAARAHPQPTASPTALNPKP